MCHPGFSLNIHKKIIGRIAVSYIKDLLKINTLKLFFHESLIITISLK